MRNREGKRPAYFLLLHRYLVLGCLLALMVVAAVGLRDFYPSIDPKQHTIRNQQAEQQSAFYADKFAEGQPLLFYLEPQAGLDIFSADALAYQRQILDAIEEQLPQVLESYSVFTLLPRGTPQPLDEPTRKWLARRAQESPLLNKTLLDPQRHSLLFFVTIKLEKPPAEPSPVEQQPFFKVGEQLDTLLQQFDDPRFKLLVSGMPVMIYHQVVELRRDLVRVLVALIVVSLLMMVIVIRSVVGIIGAVLSAGASVLLLFGGMGLLGVQIDLSFILIPTLLACAISIGYTIHFLNHYRRTINRVGQPYLALEIAWKRSFKPLFFTTLTTVLSLLSLLQTRIPVMQVAGAASAMAVLIVFLMTVTILPCILSFQPHHLWGAEIRRRRQVLEDSKFINQALLKFSHWMLAARIPVMLTALLLSLVMFFFLLKVDITLDYTRQMGPHLPFSQQRTYLQETGYVPFDSIALMLNFEPRQVLEPQLLMRVEQLQTELEQRYPSLVTSTSSLANVLQDFNSFLYNRDDLPPSAALVNGMLLQLRTASAVDPYLWVSKDLESLKLQINLVRYDAAAVLEMGDWLQQRAAELLPELQRSDMRGFIYEESSKNQLLTWRMLGSYGLSLLLITLVFWLLFRKLSVTMVAMIPNLLPVIIGGGLVGLLGIKLDYILMMIAPMVIGLAVDDTIHFCHYALSRYHTTGNLLRSLDVTMRHIGVSLIETSLILSLAFSTFSLARTSIIANMGWLAIVGISVALLADLTLTPILLYQLLKRQQQKKMLAAGAKPV